ncbi:MAG: ABC transporter permease subunit [Microthrixaceae bacterium]
MHLEVIRRAFRDRLTMSVVTGSGIGVLIIAALFIYQGLGIDTEAMVAGFPEALRSLIGVAGSGVNYVLSEVFGLMVPIVVLVVGISGGVAAGAGEERDGTATLLFGQPISRRGVLGAKALAAVGHVLVTAALTMAFTMAGGFFVDTGVRTVDLGATCLLAAGLGIAFAMLALAISAATGSTTLALGVSSGVGVVAYLVKSLFPLIKGWENLAKASPWYYYDGSDPLVSGLDVAHLSVLLSIGAVGLTAGLVAIDRRDLGAGSTRRRLKLPPRLSRLVRPRISGVYTFSLWNRSSLTLVTGVSLALMSFGVGAMYPGLKGTLADVFKDLPDSFAGFIGSTDLASGSGWINAELLSILAPLTVIGVSTAIAAGSLAGEIQRRRLVVLLGHPVRRSSVVISTAVTIAVVAVVICAITGVGLAGGSAIGGLGLGLRGIVGAMLHLAALGIFFGMVGLAFASRLSSKLSVGLSIALALVAYLVQAILPLSQRFSRWALVSPWHYFSANDPLNNGISVGYVCVLLGSALVVGWLAVLGFEGRDVT